MQQNNFKLKSSSYTLDSNIVQELNKNKLQISQNNWQNNKLKQTLSILSEWDVSKLKATNYDRNYILKSLSNIKFTNLLTLKFVGVKIDSIEGINLIKMPKIQTIELNFNNIRSISAFKKCDWPKLKELSFETNQIHELNPLTFLNCLSLNNMHLNFSLQKIVNRYVDFPQIGKLKMNVFDDLHLQSEIGTERLQVLRKRHPAIPEIVKDPIVYL